MKTKIEDARYEEGEARRKFKKKLDYIKRRTGTNTELYDGFNSLMQEEVEFQWREQKEKRKKKVAHLIKKWRNVRPAPPETHRGVTISTETLKEIFEGDEHQETQALNYGGVELSESEQKILKLGPKFTTYGKIDKVQMEAASEVMVDKIRWEMRSRQEREGPWTEEEEWKQVEAKTVHDEAKQTMEFSIPFMKYGLTILMQKPKQVADIFSILQPFSSSTWLLTERCEASPRPGPTSQWPQQHLY